MAVGKKLLSVFFSFTLVMGLLPYSAFADPLDSSSDSTEFSSDVSTSNGSEFADGGVASKPDPNDSEGGMDSNGSVSGGEDPEFGTDDEFADEQELSAPDYSDGKLAIWADGLDDPSDITDVYPPDTNEIEAYANGSSLQPMTFSSEMLYFCKYESSCNYDQGLSSGDGYHAMGYFQFDNRYGLGSFLKAVYNYNPSTYSALKVIGDRYGWDVTGATRSNGAFTQLGNDLNTAWHAAYKANPTEFSNLQNGWAYIDSYNGSLGARGCLKAFGISLDNRPDCIKGLCWGMVNLFGAGGGASYINNGNYYGANWFFKNSGINDSMSDEAFVTTLCDYVVNNVAKRYPKQSIYWTGWQNRYKSEKADCLKYLQASNYIAPSPKNVTAAASGSGEVTLSWDPVDGAQAYAVAEYVGGGYRTYTTSCASTSYTVGDLSNGKEHSFLVQARVGGRWSAVSADLHVSATPQGPTRPEPKAEPGNGTVKLTWDKVPGATKYAVTREGTTVASYTESCEFEARGLANGVSYGYRVRALIDGSWTPLTDSTVWAAPSDPEAPKAVASLDAEGSVNLKWSAVDGADKYAIALKTNGGYSTYTYDCRRTEFSVKNLKPGNYQFLVQAHLPSGWSSFSANDLVSIRVPDPSSPMVAVGYSGSNSAVLSWDSVPGAAKYAIAEYKNGSFCNLSIDHKATSYEVKDLNLGEKHRYLVQAFVDGAWSKYSEDDLVEVIVPDEKSPKAKAEATGDGQVTLSWDLVPGADRYAIAEYIDGGYRTYTTSCKGQSYTVDNLGNGNEHKFLIQAQVNGKWSAASPDLLVAATPHGVMAPTVKAKAGDLSATLEWNSVPGATRYAIASQNGDGSFTTYTYNCGGTSFTVKGLIGGRTYKMLVQAYVDGKWSPFSSVDLVSVKPYGTNTPTGQQMMSDIANNSGFTSGTSYLILVSRSRHEVGVFRGSFNNWNCIKFWSCVTGAPSTPTITGEYRTTGFKRTNLSTDTRARWCTQINGGYFFHSILASNSELGNSQSHGCIRLAVENAKWIYDNIWQGTKVYIY